MTTLRRAPFLSNHEFVTACDGLLHYVAAAPEKDYWASAVIEHRHVCREHWTGLDTANTNKGEAMLVFTRRALNSLEENGENVNSVDETSISDEEDSEVNHVVLAISMTC
jgi:hypothetical protein